MITKTVRRDKEDVDDDCDWIKDWDDTERGSDDLNNV